MDSRLSYRHWHEVKKINFVQDLNSARYSISYDDNRYTKHASKLIMYILM